MASRKVSLPRAWRRFVRRLALVLVPCLAGAARAEDPPVPAPAPPASQGTLLAQVVSDPGGEASRLLREAQLALASDDPDTAFQLLVKVAEEYRDVPVPLGVLSTRIRGRADDALRWPARSVVSYAFATLDEGMRKRLEARWAPHTQVLWQSFLRGKHAALDTLARDYGGTARGGEAALLLAERDLEAGRLVDAARRLEAWLELHPEASAVARASVAVRLADALGAREDAGALEMLQVLHRDLRQVGVPVRGAQTTLGDRMAAVHARRRSAPTRPPRVAPLSEMPAPTAIWSRSIEDAAFLRSGPGGDIDQGIRAGAWGQGETLVLHEGRVVRRLDLYSGLERWRFPGLRQAAVHDPRERYQSYDLPLRTVTHADGRILVVLGEPAATGRYKFLSQEFDADQLGQESRTRLACLDLETGRLLWTTGAAGDTHPVLGDGATGCSSPPLVVGQDVYCLFARRLGATSFHLACLDLETGQPRWVTALASGESGRSDDTAGQQDRFTTQRVHSVPWGARPTLADGEICAVPDAGFAAGVGAEDGAVRWIRALPRYAMSVVLPASLGHSARNVPLSWGDAWIIAAMDSPRLVCLAKRTGDLRWGRGGETPGDPPAWRDLLGIAPDERGRPLLRLSGWAPMTMDPADGALVVPGHVDGWLTGEGAAGAAALDAGDRVLRFAAGSLQAQSWESASEDTVPPVERVIEQPGVPLEGDLVPVGDAFVVVGLERVAVLVPPSVRESLGARTVQDDAGAAAERALAAALGLDPAGMQEALALRNRVPVGRGRATLDAHIAAQVERAIGELAARDHVGEQLEDAEVEAWIPIAEALPPPVAGPSLRRLGALLLDRERDGPGADLLLHWIEVADDSLVDVDGVVAIGQGGEARGGRLRGDLLAGLMLRERAARPGVHERLLAREAPAQIRVAVAAAQGEEALREAVRRTAGTAAATWGRRTLLERLRKAGRAADAAGVLADLRLDPPWIVTPATEQTVARRAQVARLQLDEAVLLGREGEHLRARTLVSDLERWAPGGIQDEAGRSVAAVRDELRERFGWFPRRGDAGPPLDVWREDGGPRDRDEIRSVEFVPLTGPGADKRPQIILLVRGLTAELWSSHTRSRIAALPGPDEGWFGGSLASIDRWVPGGGIRIRSIVAGEPADASGVRGGDWIRRWDGQAVPDLPTFMNLVASSRPGLEIPVEINRRGERVLDRFTAGRRPAGQGRMLDYGPVWVAEDGRLLMPGRTGLTWIDPVSKRRTHAWAWRDPGVVRRVRVADGRAYVSIQRGLLPDVVVAVDVALGKEVWRQEVEGGVAWTEPVGSALWIQATGPAHAVVVDRRDGRPRADLRCFDFRRHEFRKNWADADPAAVAAGRGFFVAGHEARHELNVFNTTTGRVEHAEVWSYGRTRLAVGRYQNPQVAAGAFAAVARSGSVQLFFPDPLGGPASSTQLLGSKLLLTDQRDYGRLDQDTRIVVRGDRLFLVRVPIQGRDNVNVSVYALKTGNLPAEPTRLINGDDVFAMVMNKRWMKGSALPTRYVMDVRAYFEGVLVSAGRLAGDHEAETWWVSSELEGGGDDYKTLLLFAGRMQDARRPLPVRAGRRLLVPTDRGANYVNVSPSAR